MKGKILILILLTAVCLGTASAEFGGIVYDPTNYSNALLRYFQLQQHLIQLRNSYQQLVNQYNLALQMERAVQNMSALYRAQFASWRNTFAKDTYGNTGGWVTGINSGQLPTIATGYRQ